jgi:hypothetical protein
MECEVRETGSERGEMSAAIGRREWAAEEDRGAAGVGHPYAVSDAVKKMAGQQEERKALRVARDENPGKRWTHCLPLGELLARASPYGA